MLEWKKQIIYLLREGGEWEKVSVDRDFYFYIISFCIKFHFTKGTYC